MLALCVFCSRIFTLNKSSVRCMDGGKTGLDEAFVFVLFHHRSFVVCRACSVVKYSIVQCVTGGPICLNFDGISF